VVGTVVSTFIIGYLTYAVGKLGWIDIDRHNPIEPLLFGALISAVDPVATLSIMGSPELNCDPLLYSLVFGESVLNDAVAIVLFHVFSKYYDSDVVIGHREIPRVLIEFVGVSGGSVLVGVATGLLCAFLFKHTQIHLYPTYEVGLLFLFAYGSYALAEAISMSGIMSLFFCGIVLAHYNSYNLSETSQVGAEVIFQSLSQISETFVFVYMGMGLFTGRFSGWSPVSITFAILFCLLARIFNTFPISAVSNMFRREKIPFRMQIIIWFSGLRGAIAFALSQTMPGEHKGTYETTTLGVVFFTTIVCGGLTETMLKCMNMRTGGFETIPSSSPRAVPDDEQYWEQMNLLDETLPGPASPNARATIKRPASSVPFSADLHRFWRNFDNRFMKPLFGGRFGDDHDDTALGVLRPGGELPEQPGS